MHRGRKPRRNGYHPIGASAAHSARSALFLVTGVLHRYSNWKPLNMNKLPALLTSVCALALTLPTIATAYDAELAAQIQTNVTGRMDRQYLSDTPPKIDAPELVEALSKGQDILLLDIRTPEEHGVVTLNHPSAQWIPVHELFTTDNLDRLPTDKQIAVVCLSGYRAAFATGLLRAVGFEDVVFVTGGLAGLVQAFKPSTLGPQARHSTEE